jgi:signal transduction histidine kinase
VSNLVDNAIRHNLPDGHVQVTTEEQRGRAILAVSNTGPLVPPSEVNRLFQPFQQMSPERTTSKDGVGLGLSIVSAIAATHGATLDATAQPEGGLRVEVTFPPPTDNVPHRPPVNADPDSPPPAGPA